jgi:hypothetical protein
MIKLMVKHSIVACRCRSLCQRKQRVKQMITFLLVCSSAAIILCYTLESTEPLHTSRLYEPSRHWLAFEHHLNLYIVSPRTLDRQVTAG